MKVRDSELRLLYQRGTRSADRSACPDADALSALARGELGPAERGRLAEHLAGCSSCALEARLAAEVAPWSEELSARLGEDAAEHRPRRPPAAEPARRRSWMPLPALALAAATLLAIAAGLWLVLAPVAPPSGDVLRGDADEVVPASGSELAEAPARLAWPPQAGATGYRVALHDARAQPLWESQPLARPELDLPAEARELLRPGATYLWLVRVDGPAARRELGPYRFRLGR